MEKQVKLIREFTRELKGETSHRGVERLVQVTIQALLNLGLMVISVLQGKRPSRYSEIGPILHELGVLNQEQAGTLKTIADLRDVLVHMYAHVDREKVLDASKRLMRDAIEISNTILNSVKGRGVDSLEQITDSKLEDIVSRLRSVLEGRVLLAYLFGGRVKGYKLKGDYDIAVLMPENYTLYDLGLPQVEIAEILGVEEDMVDVVCLNNAPPELILEALNGVPIIEDPRERLKLEVKTLRELLDLRESFRITTNPLKNSIFRQ